MPWLVDGNNAQRKRYVLSGDFPNRMNVDYGGMAGGLYVSRSGAVRDTPAGVYSLNQATTVS